ncbi:hypothetical protein EYF80_002720 [Liparis tanakae]|uniref:Uncharacterized protein n=1 Tax=Liparis tanakae TaxID=230148 RepID=A0A4Z2J9D7_9TELE|nr:hypothetical protein EYF80_002720 [Liparis tanakae]
MEPGAVAFGECYKCPPHAAELESQQLYSYPLKFSSILSESIVVPLLHAKLTPQVLLYLLTDTCSPETIPPPAAGMAACSGGIT